MFLVDDLRRLENTGIFSKAVLELLKTLPIVQSDNPNWHIYIQPTHRADLSWYGTSIFLCIDNVYQ